MLHVAITVEVVMGSSILGAAPHHLLDNSSQPVARPLPRRVAFLHLPKTGGSSVGWSLARARAPACKMGTGNIPLCPCLGSSLYAADGNVAKVNGTALYSKAACLKRNEWLSSSQVAVMELSFPETSRVIHKPSEWVWLASIREPRSWFYSAVGHMCSHFGHQPAAFDERSGCSSTTMHGLLEKGWFEPTSEPRNIHYYFHHANVQSRMLEGFFSTPNWLLCDISRLQLLADVVASMVGAALPLQSDNTAVWQRLSDFKRHIPWSDLQYNYAVDEALHASVMRSGGCLGHVTSPMLSATLNEIAVKHSINVSWLS